MFGFVEGVIRWNVRVAGYALVLVTDQYPPFRLAPDLTAPMVAAGGRNPQVQARTSRART